MSYTKIPDTHAHEKRVGTLTKLATINLSAAFQKHIVGFLSSFSVQVLYLIKAIDLYLQYNVRQRRRQ